MKIRQKSLAVIARFATLTLSLFAVATAQAVTLNVVDKNGVAVNGFRWILQQDATFPVNPAEPATDPDDLLSLGFHASYHPVAQNGNSDTDSAEITVPVPAADDPPGRYYVSVLPYADYSISGQSLEVVDGTETVTVTVQQHPIPTAQIALYLFHDNFPVNGAPDLPEETNPLPGDPGHVDWTQFNILVEEPAGRYGIAGGQVIQDAFGNPLGTEYDMTCDATGANPGTGTNACLDADGAPIVVTLGDGTIQPLADGTLLIKNLAPGKYGIVVIPPTGTSWQQTTTIEGTKVIDAWVKANEPPFFVEFGPPGPHVFMGFVQPFNNLSADAGATLSGTITDMHMSRPPNFAFFSGRPFPNCWVAVNEADPAGLGEGLYAGPCDADSGFSIANVPPGSYQLKAFDANLDVVIASQGFTVDLNGVDCNGGGSCNFGEVAVFNWFTRLNTGIFNDIDQDGFWDANETGIGPESQENVLRWRDGTIYQAFPTDGDGLAPFDEVFPFFHWLVAETSFGNKKATGATFVTDAGGFVDKTPDLNGDPPGFPGYGELTPLAQYDDDGTTALPDCDMDPTAEVCATTMNIQTEEGVFVDVPVSRTERGPVLTAATQGFLGQVSVMHFGKVDYVDYDRSANPPTYVGENGGISGIVYYATTRAEDNPQLAAAEEWEPGVPRVQVNLYADGDIDSFPLGDFPGIGDVDWNEDGIRDLDNDVIDDINGDDVVTLSDVDNYPFDWYCQGEIPCPGTMGPEDVNNSDPGTVITFDLGDAVQITWTDSWDDSLPTGCQGANNLGAAPYMPPVADNRCFDGLRNFNQIRPGVFDGGYAFADYDMGHLGGVRTGIAATAIQGFYDSINATVPDAGKLQLGLIPGDYIVEAVTPPGYKLMKEEDKNVDFGDQYIPSPQAIAAYCVGDERVVPPYMSMTTKDGSGGSWTSPGVADDTQLITGIDSADAAAPFAGDLRPLCDRKKVPLSAAQNAAAEFWVMTDVPIVGNVSGVILNDLGNEFNPNSPAFGEKYAPPNVPVGFYDWNGAEVARVYADTNGRYNLVVPSTYTTNLPQPSGMSPNMLVSCMNDAGTGAEPDPFWNSQFSQFCYTFQYMPGAITYLDTPVEPIAAFASPITFPTDCERPESTPVIASVTRDTLDGPYALPGETILIDSMGLTEVDNPDWDGTTATTRKITRDYSFAAGCTVELEDEAGIRTPLTGVGCGAAQASGVVPAVDQGAYQVVVTNPDGAESPIGVTLTVDDTRPNQQMTVWRVDGVGVGLNYSATIQGAIDAAGAGDLILVGPKADPDLPPQYDELVVMWKPVKLQGWGAGAVTINARQSPTEKIANWRTKVTLLRDFELIDQLPGQEVGPAGFPALAEAIFPTEEGAGIFVAGKSSGNNSFGHRSNRGARIDGFSIIGASTGGAIAVNGYAQYLQIGNNRLVGNAGAFNGGIRIGHPQLITQQGNNDIYTDAVNDFVRIHHNHIARNGGRGGAGGGISLHTGADEYTVEQNWVCGNFSSGSGGGIGHLGLSDLGVIEDNMILFNESFAQAGPRSGGGIFIAGQTGLQPDNGGLLLSPGSGSVTVDSNVIRGNLAGAGDGGGIQLLSVNGEDATGNNCNKCYSVDIVNNMINNNVAGLAGGGIAMQDAIIVSIRNNTVAHNETTATTALAFAPGVFNESNATPAGIVARAHSTDFALARAELFEGPVISDSIIEHNRSFYWLNYDDPLTPEIETGLFPANCTTAPTGCDLTSVEGYTADLAVMDGPFTVADPLLVGELDPQFSLLTNNADNAAYIGVNGNVTGDPGFVNGYFNGAMGNLDITEFTTLSTAGAFDEGGNFIQVVYSPLSIIDSATGNLLDYHVGAGAAIDAGDPANTLTVDIDDDARTVGEASDIGADEVPVVAP